MKKLLLSFLYLTLVTVTLLANEETVNKRVINGKAPQGMEALANDIKSDFTGFINPGPYLMKEYCYKQKAYIVYREDVMSEGYILSKDLPKELECSKSPKNIIEKNKLGIYIGMPKSEVERLIKVSGLENSQVIIWKSVEIDNSIAWDIITYTTFVFQNNLLTYIRVTITETN